MNTPTMEYRRELTGRKRLHSTRYIHHKWRCDASCVLRGNIECSVVSHSTTTSLYFRFVARWNRQRELSCVYGFVYFHLLSISQRYKQFSLSREWRGLIGHNFHPFNVCVIVDSCRKFNISPPHIRLANRQKFIGHTLKCTNNIHLNVYTLNIALCILLNISRTDWLLESPG